MTDLLHRRDTFVTVHSKCLKIPPSAQMHFTAHVWGLYVVHLSLSSRLWGRGIQNASEQFISCIHLSFINLDLHPTSHTKKCNVVRSGVLAWFKQVCLGNHSELDICSYELFSYYEQYYYLLKYWYFLLNHPVFSVTLKC